MKKWNKEKIILDIHNLEKRLKRKPKKRDTTNLYSLSRIYFGTWNNMMEYAGYKVKRIQRPKIPDSDSDIFYYFLGLLNTDGHIVYDKSNKCYRVLLFTSHREEKDQIISLIRKLFNYEASVRKKEFGYAKRINYEIHICSKNLCEFFINKLSMFSGAKSLTIEISPFVFNSKNSKIWHFIRGVIDGDGSIIKTENSSMLKIPSGSKKFIDGISCLFKKLGFNSGKISQERKNLWLFRITMKEDIKKLYKFIYSSAGNYYYKRKERIWRQYI